MKNVYDKTPNPGEDVTEHDEEGHLLCVCHPVPALPQALKNNTTRWRSDECPIPVNRPEFFGFGECPAKNPDQIHSYIRPSIALKRMTIWFAQPPLQPCMR